VLAIGVFLFWAADQAGYTRTAWLGGSLLLLVLLALRLSTERLTLRGLPRSLHLAVACLALFVVWNFLSLSWATSKGVAWDGANRSLLYLIVFLLFLLPRQSRWQAVASVAVLVGGIAAVGLVTVMRASAAADPHSFVIAGRLSEPAGYPNANTALFLIPFWGALWLASRRASSLASRVVGLTSAGVLLEVATLPQSRGSVIAAPLTLILFFVVARERLRALVALGAVLVVWGVSLPYLLHPYRDTGSVHGLHEAFLGARNALLLSAAGLALAAVAIALVDRRLHLGEQALRRIRIGVAVVLCVCAGAAAAAAVRSVSHPLRRLDSAWTDFKHGAEPGRSATRFTGLGSNRYDFWRVALKEFERHPLTGVGADNFAIDYVRERRSNEEPRYPHSVVLRLLSETGLVGTILFAGFLLSVGTALVRIRRGAHALERDLAAVAIVCFGYWLIHGAVDWFWEFAGLGAIAFALLGAAASAARVQTRAFARPSGLPLIFVPLGLAALGSFGLPWLSARDMAQAEGMWRTDTPAAYRALDRARTLNPLTEEPDLVAALIAAQKGDRVQMERSLLRSKERLPQNWYVHFELGLLYGVEHKRALSLAELELARRLDPGEPVIGIIRERVVKGDRLTLTTPDQLFIARIRERTS
jgi:hypothetical protein